MLNCNSFNGSARAQRLLAQVMDGSYGWYRRLEVFGVMRAGFKGEFRDRVVGRGPNL